MEKKYHHQLGEKLNIAGPRIKIAPTKSDIVVSFIFIA